MAWAFHDQIAALTNFDADAATAVASGETYQVMTAQWLTDAAKEILQLLPPNLLPECAVIKTLDGSNPTLTELDKKGSILSVVRYDGSYEQPCREISAIYRGRVNDSGDMFNYAPSGTADPLFTIYNNILEVYPTPTASQYAIVRYVDYPAVAYDDASIDNFPDEAEYLVALRAAITAAQYQLTFEEDVEIYEPVLNSLRLDYRSGILAMQQGQLFAKADPKSAQQNVRV